MTSSDNPVELFGLRLAHVGINTSTPEDAASTADALCALLGVERGEEPFPVSSFAGSLVEVMNNGGRGSRGHIGLHVDDIDAAQACSTRGSAGRSSGPTARARPPSCASSWGRRAPTRAP